VGVLVSVSWTDWAGLRQYLEAKTEPGDCVIVEHEVARLARLEELEGRNRIELPPKLMPVYIDSADLVIRFV
jgi:hypothetical protein